MFCLVPCYYHNMLICLSIKFHLNLISHFFDKFIWYISDCFETAFQWYNCKLLFGNILWTGALHCGYATALHLLSSWDDPMGSWHLWSSATTRNLSCGRIGENLGTWSLEIVPGQVCMIYKIIQNVKTRFII